MAKVWVLYNPKCSSGKGKANAEKIESVLRGKDIEYIDVTTIDDMDAYISSLAVEDDVILCGGDGTLNYYINHTKEETRKHKLGYYATGTGNDFLNDIGGKMGEVVEDISKYLQNLPVATIKGEKYLVLNGVGYGIDGYCCEVGDAERLKSDKPVNYTSIAIKGILFHFKPCTATVTVDGRTAVYKHTWLVPAMNGRFYGGGMMATPNQDRLSKDRKVSLMVYHHPINLIALIVFPKIFKGEHIKKKKIVEIIEAKSATVAFDRPCALQVDGETILNVSEYSITVSED